VRARAAWVVAAIGVVGLLLGVVLPRVVGAPWAAIAAIWHGLSFVDVALLSILWLAGLAAYASVLMAALPGLSRRRALTLNLTGSAVSNVLPAGGGLGIGLNYLMVRRWGFSPGEFSLFTGLSNAWSILAKAVLPVVAVVALLAGDVHTAPRLLLGGVLGSAALLLLVLTATVAVGSDAGVRLVGRSVQRLPAALRRGAWSDGPSAVAQLTEVRHSAARVVRSGWRAMTVGMLVYYALQAVLLWLCLGLLGSTLTPVAVLALFAFERALTAVPVTPGGSGIVEVATTALAIALGGSSAVSAAGVLLYRAFTFGLEIPVGAAWLLGWFLLHRHRRTTTPTPAVPLPVGEAA
jgi:uncharacterized membrane protein YbhN (UPF0104 family)